MIVDIDIWAHVRYAPCPRIADGLILVILNLKLTQQAYANTPPDVELAFAPPGLNDSPSSLPRQLRNHRFEKQHSHPGIDWSLIAASGVHVVSTLSKLRFASIV